ASLCISRRTEILQNPSVVATKSPVVFSTVPNHRVANRIRLIEFAARYRSVQPCKTVKRNSRQPPVERVCRNSGNTRVARYVDHSKKKFRRRQGVVVGGDPRRIGDSPLSVRPSGVSVPPLCVRASRQRREWVHNRRRIPRPVESYDQIVPRCSS